jgi:hypothetical protein
MKVYYALKVHTHPFCAFIEESMVTDLSSCERWQKVVVAANSNPRVRENSVSAIA